MYPKGDSGPYIARFTCDHSDIQDYPVDSHKLPPLVTAASSAQFYQLQGFIQHVHQDLKAEHSDVKLIVYDLGLYRREREIVSWMTFFKAVFTLSSFLHAHVHVPLWHIGRLCYQFGG